MSNGIHPLKRDLYSQSSWRKAGSLERGFSTRVADGLSRIFCVSRCDLLLQRAMKNDVFNPEKMMKLLDLIQQNVVVRKIRGRKIKEIQVPPELDTQAYLLTEDMSQDAAVMDDMGEGRYVLKKRVEATIRAMRKKLAILTLPDTQKVQRPEKESCPTYLCLNGKVMLL